MKNIILKNRYLLLLIVVGVLFASFRNNNGPKPSRIGYLSINSLVLQIEDYRNNRGQLDTTIYEFNVALQDKVKEFQLKQQTFVKDSATMNAIVKADKISEIQNLSQSMQAFRQVAEAEVSRQDSIMVQPILDRVQGAINEVAEIHGYSHIVNSDLSAQNGPRLFLYADDESDVSELVLEEYYKNP